MIAIRCAGIHRYRKTYGPGKPVCSDFPLGFLDVYNPYIKSAKLRNLEFSLSKDEFYTLSQQNCFYCDQEPSNKKIREKDFIYSGIDRKDNNLGYTIDNSVPCCKICNVAKNNLEFDKFIQHICSIYNNLHKKQLI